MGEPIRRLHDSDEEDNEEGEEPNHWNQNAGNGETPEEEEAPAQMDNEGEAKEAPHLNLHEGGGKEGGQPQPSRKKAVRTVVNDEGEEVAGMLPRVKELQSSCCPQASDTRRGGVGRQRGTTRRLRGEW